MKEKKISEKSLTPTEQAIVYRVVQFTKRELGGAEGGHDWWHIMRVWKLAQIIGEQESVNVFVVNLGALLHDIADSKFHDGDESVGPHKAKEFLSGIGVDNDTVVHIVNIIKNTSFKGGDYAQDFRSKELDVVQDADRLDALGAIGIARTFNYGGYKNREIYNPEIKPNLNMTVEEYKQSTAPSINHFYEKLLLLKDIMNTKSGKKIAKHRHEFIILYLKEFHQEWDGVT